MDRRAFIASVAGGLVIARSVAEAQQAKGVPRIGYLAQNSAEIGQRQRAAFRQGLGERGWVEGQNIVIEIRFADGKVDRFPALIAELIRLKVDIIVTTSSATTWAAKDATKSIPIVMAASANALGEGLVTSLAHPGGNIIGMTFLAGPEMAGKQLQLLMEMAPTASSTAVLVNPTNRSHAAFSKELKVAARSLGTQLQVLEVPNPDQLDSAFAAMTRQRAAALLVLTDSMFLGQQQRVADLAAKAAGAVQPEGVRRRRRTRLLWAESLEHVPTCRYTCRQDPEGGEAWRHSSRAADQVRVGDQPQNRKALGLTIPQSLLLRADEVIQ